MKKIVLNQSGFSAPRKLLIVGGIALALLAVGMGFVKGSQDNQSASPTTVTGNTTVQPTTANVSYFVIKEWNVRAPYSGTLTLQYKLLTDDNGSLNYAPITSTLLASSDPLCQNRGGSIQRFAPNDAVMPDNLPAKLYFANTKNTSHSFVNGYYYMYVAPVSECSVSDSANTAQKLNETAVQEISAELEAIPAK